MTRHEYGDEAAAYVLGALEPVEAEAFRRHLEECVVCRDEVAAFREAVDALPATAPQYRAPKQLRRRVIDAVREDAAERQRSTSARATRGRALRPAWRPTPVAALLSAAVVALGALAGIELAGGSGSGSSRTIAASIGDAQLHLVGTHAELIVGHLPAPASGQIYELWLEQAGRPPRPTNTLFSVSRRGTADVGVPGAVTGQTSVMVTAEPAGGTQAPTTAPVIVARLS